MIVLRSSAVRSLLLLLTQSAIRPFFLTWTTEEAPVMVVRLVTSYIKHSRVSTNHNVSFQQQGILTSLVFITTL